MQSYRNVSDILIKNRDIHDKGITFIDEKIEDFVSFNMLYNDSLRMLKGLQERGLKPDDEIILQILDPRKFLTMFWACILGGMVPIPIDARNKHEFFLRLFRVWKILKNGHLATTDDQLRTLNNFAFENDLVELVEKMRSRLINVTELAGENRGEGDLYHPAPGKTAYIQFSSGTTGDPKGVLLTHENLLTNIVDIAMTTKATADESTLSWMPLTHDMGLIGFHLTPSAMQMQQYIIPTVTFVMNPVLWIKKISEHRSTMTASPNFGYKHFLNFFNPAQETGLDLSSLRIIFNGAEPIARDLCQRFLDVLGVYGLQKGAMFPVFGMAEASLAVSFPVPGEEPLYHCLDRFSMEIGKPVENADPKGNNCIHFTDLGFPLKSIEVRIADADNRPLPENHLGHIHIRGKNVTAGYYQNAEATRMAYTGDGWFITGDLGFLKNKRLTVTGREKDIIFSNGLNYYSHDIESVAERVRGVTHEGISAVGVYNDRLQEDELILFIKNKNSDMKEFSDLAKEVQKCIYINIGIRVNEVIPVEKFPTTTAGKIQRGALRKNYIKGDYKDTIEKLNALKGTTITTHGHKGDAFDTLARDITAFLLAELAKELEDVIYQFNDETDLFDLGIDSLTLATLLIRIEHEVGITLSPLYLLEFSTIKELSKNLARTYFNEFEKYFARKR